MSRYATVQGRKLHLSGWKKDQPDLRDRKFSFAPQVLPSSVDLSPYCPPVRDQWGIGSCTANATLEALGFLYIHKSRPDPFLSRLFLYWHTRVSEGTAPDDDAGAQIRDTVKTLARLGACLEKTWPYIDDGKWFSVKPTQAANDEALEHQAIVYYRCVNFRTLKASLAQGFPVIFGFSVLESFMGDEVARTGKVAEPSASEAVVGGHAVLAVGYDDATRRVKCQNSWGTGWGDRGFFTLPYTYFEELLADDYWTIRSAEMPS